MPNQTSEITHARGGKRSGAGRKKGSKLKRTQEIAAKAAAEGVSPVEYMLMTLRDETQSHEERMKAAIAAAPYIHPRLQAVQHTGDKDNPIRLISEMMRDLDGLTRGLPNIGAAFDDDDQQPN